MGEAADHEYNSRYASIALKNAIQELSQRSGTPLQEFEGISLGKAFAMANESYGTELPEFWKVWDSWNSASDDPAPLGEL